MNWRTPTAQIILLLITPFTMLSALGLWLVERLVGEQSDDY
jgi:hypothetical protein